MYLGTVYLYMLGYWFCISLYMYTCMACKLLCSPQDFVQGSCLSCLYCSYVLGLDIISPLLKGHLKNYILKNHYHVI